MTTNIKDIEVNYIQYGKGKDIILLHGWGQNIEMMKPLGDRLTEFKVTIVDLPGFGCSKEPKSEFTIHDYSEILEELIIKLKIKNPTIIGHSFGGRIGIVYSSKYKVDKLILLGSPCVREDRDLGIKVRTLKFLKKIPVVNKLEQFAKNHMGSTDYKNASPIMKRILVNTVNEDLSDCARSIKCPTLMIWGTLDEAAPLEDAKKLEALIKDAGLVTYEGGTHYVYLERLNEVSNVIKTFLRSE